MAEVTSLTAAARAVSERLVAPLGRRWLHVQAVAARAEQLVEVADAEQCEVLVAAAWLHDVGYAGELALTGLHPLDGAVYLAGEGWPDVVVSLVAHHTGAVFEADERGLLGRLSAFDEPPAQLLDALTTADMVTGPGGAWVRAADRVAEILTRYEPEHPVHRAVSRSSPELVAAVHRVEARTPRPVQPPPPA